MRQQQKRLSQEEKDGKIIVTKKTYTLKEEPTNKTGKVVTGGVVVNYYYVEKTEVKEVPITEEKTVIRIINYLEKGTNKVLKEVTTQLVKLTKTNTVNKERNGVTEGTWTIGVWDVVTPEAIENYKAPTPAVVEKVEVNSTTEDGVINVYYEPKVTPPSIPELEPKSNLVPKPVPNPEPSPAPELKLTLTPIKKIVVDENQQKNKLANTGLESDSIRIYGLMLLGVSLVMIKQRKYIK